MRRRWIYMVPAAILGMLLFMAIGGTIVKLLWNWLLPPLLDLPVITFWQALGLLALCRILFGGVGRSGRCSRGRWQNMTPEERERVREGMRRRFGFSPGTSEGGPAPS